MENATLGSVTVGFDQTLNYFGYANNYFQEVFRCH